MYVEVHLVPVSQESLDESYVPAANHAEAAVLKTQLSMHRDASKAG